jgi:hypothetical protein
MAIQSALLFNSNEAALATASLKGSKPVFCNVDGAEGVVFAEDPKGWAHGHSCQTER